MGQVRHPKQNSDTLDFYLVRMNPHQDSIFIPAQDYSCQSFYIEHRGINE